MIDNWNLCDIFRIQNENIKLCTWQRGLQYSRLDYFLISTHLMNINIKTSILPSILTDHKILLLRIEYNRTEKFGNSTWKLNNSLLYDEEFKIRANNIITQTQINYEYLTNKSLLKVN